METSPAATLSTEALRNCTAQIVAGFTRRNHVMPDQMPELITTVYKTLSGLGGSQAVAAPVNMTPAVPIRKSITPDYLICLEDGKRLKMMKRHLMSTYGLTPDQYRLKWNLPPDYPMTARNYAQTRSDLAKQAGLGRGGRGPILPPTDTSVGALGSGIGSAAASAESAVPESTAVATAPRKRAPRKAAPRSKKAAATRKTTSRSKKAAATSKSKPRSRSRSRSKPTEAAPPAA